MCELSEWRPFIPISGLIAGEGEEQMGLLVWLSGRVRADRPRTLGCDDD